MEVKLRFSIPLHYGLVFLFITITFLIGRRKPSNVDFTFVDGCKINTISKVLWAYINLSVHILYNK